MFFERGDVFGFAGDDTGLRTAQHFISAEAYEIRAGLEHFA